jgi:hypothetical protein
MSRHDHIHGRNGGPLVLAPASRARASLFAAAALARLAGAGALIAVLWAGALLAMR